jgi:hypothetical protein
MALEDEQLDPQVSEAEAPPIRQFLKVQKQGIGRAAGRTTYQRERYPSRDRRRTFSWG